jgi:small conductance mechanosensitive channel
LVLKLLSTFLLGKGQTLCKLIHNAIKYLSVFVSVYFMLQYFGFPIGTVIGSIGIVSLALSLGARDMAADVLAGLSIVFEKSFEVGDIVQIGNAKGVVQEIGVRSTKLLTMDNNLMTISNHSIDTIVNNTRKISWYTLSFKIPIDSPLEEIEAMLNRELPEISNRCDRIAGELRYCGVESFGSGMNQGMRTITLLIEGQCNERDLEDVNLYVNRELLLLLRREGIDIR